MTYLQKIFFELLQIAIGNKVGLSRMPSQKEWLAIYKMAKQQSMIGILLCGVESFVGQNKKAVLGPPMGNGKMPVALFMDWMGQKEKVKIKNEEANRDCKIIRDYFTENGFRSAIMKGQGNASIYRKPLPGPLLKEREIKASPLPSHEKEPTSDSSLKGREMGLTTRMGDSFIGWYRTPGDIDLWVEGGFEKVYAFVKKTNPSAKFTEKEIYFNGMTETPVEVHHRPLIIRNPFRNKRLQQFLESEAEACYESETGFTTIKFNIIHQLAHIHLHLFTEGIGFRQLMDYYFVLLHCKEDKAELMGVVRSLGMEHFAKALMWIMKDAFGMDTERLLCEPDEKDGKFLLQEVLKSGNFGHHDAELNEKKKGLKGSIWLLLFRNLRYWRFDHWDWFWAPLWRIYHNVWKRLVKRG